MLSGHCKIDQVSLEAQVVQGAQCSSQNLQNQTDPRAADDQNRLLKWEQTGCRACSKAMQDELLQGGVIPSADCAGNQGSGFVLDLELKLALLIPKQGHLQTDIRPLLLAKALHMSGTSDTVWGSPGYSAQL